MVTSQGPFLCTWRYVVQVVQYLIHQALALFCWSKVKKRKIEIGQPQIFQAHTTNCTRICISVIKAQPFLLTSNPSSNCPTYSNSIVLFTLVNSLPCASSDAICAEDTNTADIESAGNFFQQRLQFLIFRSSTSPSTFSNQYRILY